MRIGVIIPAAGASRRYSDAGAPRSKLDEDLGGRPVLHRTVELFTKHDLVTSIIVAGPCDGPAWGEFEARHADKLGLLGVRLCRGGATHRWETVRNALALIPPDCTHVAVHDAARPCAAPELIDRVFDAAARHPAVIPAIDAADTLKLVREVDAEEPIDAVDAILGGASGPRRVRRRVVDRTLDRSGVVQVQTPQVFEAGLLRRAYAQPDLTSTDDAGLVERLVSADGGAVVVVEGDPRNIKITRPPDLALARAILGVSGPGDRATHKRF